MELERQDVERLVSLEQRVGAVEREVIRVNDNVTRFAKDAAGRDEQLRTTLVSDKKDRTAQTRWIVGSVIATFGVAGPLIMALAS